MRATGVTSAEIGRPIIAVANSFTEFVPGHVHLREVGKVVTDAIRAAAAMATSASRGAARDVSMIAQNAR